MRRMILNGPTIVSIRHQAWHAAARSCIGLVILASLITNSGAQAQQRKADEYEVKAAYLYNLGRFVEWPSSAPSSSAASFFICVLGEDPFGRSLEKSLAVQTVGKQRVEIVRVTKPQSALACRILFI